MRHTLHIFAKDVRYLRIEIGLMLLLCAAFAWVKAHISHDDWSDALVALAATYIIGMAVHADAIPGDRQFWLTRPYNRMSLAGAKLLFVFACVCLPIGLAEISVPIAAGYPLGAAMPGFITLQILIFACGAVPVIALAALTASIVPFILTGLTLALISFSASSAVGYWFPRYVGTIPESVDWIRSLTIAVAILVLATAVLLWQYRDRATGFSRVIAIVSLNVIGVVFVFLPRSVPLAVQALLSKRPELASGITVTPQRSGDSSGYVFRSREYKMVIPLTLVANKVPRDVEARGDALSLILEWPDRKWSPAIMPGVNRRSETADTANFNLNFTMDSDFYAKRRDAALTIRGSLYLTLFGDEERRTVRLGHEPVNVQDGLQCYSSAFTGEFDALLCQSFFRWPARLVYAESGERQSDFSTTQISYSPLAAELSLDPRETRLADPVKAEQVTIVTKKPLVHFRRDFEMRGIKLADFENVRFMRPSSSPRP
jgi:hypothetical protein